MAQRIRRETTNLEIAGSNPVGDITHIVWFYGEPAYRGKYFCFSVVTRYSSVGRAGDCNMNSAGSNPAGETIYLAIVLLDTNCYSLA